MTEKMANFSFPENSGAEIKVIGVGGGGGNAVNHMFKQGICDVDFIICNTDAQALNASPIQYKVQLGSSLTEGRGAGNKPEKGKQAAIENIEDVKKALAINTKMVFITAGMGGGTGTGGAPVIAEACQKLGYLTVGIVTIPFKNEGRRRIKQAIDGIKELEEFVDSLLVVNNEKIREMYGDFGISEAFARADNILATAAKGIAEIITVPGYINVDFADVETVMRKSGLAVMGTGIASGENRAEKAVEKALISPLLSNNDIRGAKNILININSGANEVTMDEVGKITDFVQERAGFDADIIWGNGKEDTLGEDISVTLIATGFSNSIIPTISNTANQSKVSYSISEEKNQTKQTISGNKKSEVVNQKTFEFNIREEEKKEKTEFESLYPNTSKKRNSGEKPEPVKDYSVLSDEEVDELENTPAFNRRRVKMNNPNISKNVSKFSVTKDKKIVNKNSYLFRKAD